MVFSIYLPRSKVYTYHFFDVINDLLLRDLAVFGKNGTRGLFDLSQFGLIPAELAVDAILRRTCRTCGWFAHGNLLQMERERSEIYGHGFFRGFGQEDEDEEKTVAGPNRVVRGRCRRTSDAFGVKVMN